MLYKIAQSVLVVIHTELLEVLVIRRVDTGTWQSVTGSKDFLTEDWTDTARREVFEETGFTCRLEEYVGTGEYTHRKGRPKIVAYWLMSIASGEFAANDEVDELVWCSFVKARRLLTYERDREILDLLGDAVGDVA